MWSLGSTHYIKNVMDVPGYLGKFLVGGHDQYRSIFFVYSIFRGIDFPKKILFFRPLLGHIRIFQESVIKNIHIIYISLQKSGAVLFIFKKTSKIFYSSENLLNFLLFRENL